MSKDSGPISQAHSRAMMADPSHTGYGHISVSDSKGGSMSKHSVPHAGHHNMHGHKMEHDHTHKSHGHHPTGVKHHETGSPFAGSGEHIKEDSHGPSNNQFGESTPKGGSIGKW